jgi:hypothetical protein
MQYVKFMLWSYGGAQARKEKIKKIYRLHILIYKRK